MEKRDGGEERGKSEETNPNVNQMTEMKPVTKEAYGRGMYANENNDKTQHQGHQQQQQQQQRASDTQSADGPVEESAVSRELKHPPPPSTGDRDLDITGMSYIE